MQWFGVAYTSRFNIKNQKSGHLFQGRFKCILVENDAIISCPSTSIEVVGSSGFAQEPRN
jgi:hypothetical protein